MLVLAGYQSYVGSVQTNNAISLPQLSTLELEITL
jgi:hypothetical protein